MNSENETGPEAEPRLVMVDGRDAVAYVILRPGPGNGTVQLEAATTEGTDHHHVSQVLRHIADQWSPRPGLQGVFDEIAVRRARQRTAHGGNEHLLPDGTGQYPETIDAEAAEMVRESAAEGGYLDWLHIVRATAARAYAEPRPAELRADLVDLAAQVTGWIQALDHRTGHRSGPALADLMQAPAEEPEETGPAEGPEPQS
ncbi:hypothetical protein IHE56_15215 [Streptomyces sp. ID01-12c]|uniref:hypothetical protein n=1 Tax=Streptomyces caniscabiei TaxID=2746961 RepID=UPI00177E26D6|nr:hypothetical protein [Streptomyces caniscabiei]MBD9703407.1 hypothetical protein [Streptomyces caniscabiei]MDX3726898.1 hypothetical protein [Streptomyces caniscabiei]